MYLVFFPCGTTDVRRLSSPRLMTGTYMYILIARKLNRGLYLHNGKGIMHVQPKQNEDTFAISKDMHVFN